MLELDQTSFQYDKNDLALSDVSVDIREGSFWVITGPSGAGKTTLLGALALRFTPVSGRVRVFGSDVTTLSHRKLHRVLTRIRYIRDTLHLLQHLSVLENLALPLIVQGADDSTSVRELEELLDWFDLRKKRDTRPMSLSTGERQRLVIARAVVTRPRILLADEPTGHLDRNWSRQIIRMFSDLNELGTTVVLATHEVELVRGMDVKRIHLQDGKMVGV